MSETPVEEMSFEEAIRDLERVVGALEGGEVPLEDSITLYERGAALRAIRPVLDALFATA